VSFKTRTAFTTTILVFCELTKQSLLKLFSLLQGFDEYMNLVLDEAEEVHTKNKTRKTLGKTKSDANLQYSTC